MSRPTQGLKKHYPYGAITHYGAPFQTLLVIFKCHWPGPRSLATTNGVSVDVLSSGYLDISVPRVRSPYVFRDRPKWSGFPIRKSTDQSLLAAPHGLSQRVTSFIASQRQGIHQMPLRRLIISLSMLTVIQLIGTREPAGKHKRP